MPIRLHGSTMSGLNFKAPISQAKLDSKNVFSAFVPVGKSVIAAENAVVVGTTDINGVRPYNGGVYSFTLASVANSINLMTNPIPFSVDPSKLKNGVAITITRWITANLLGGNGNASIGPITSTSYQYTGPFSELHDFQIPLASFGQEIQLYYKQGPSFPSSFYMKVTSEGFKFRSDRNGKSTDRLMQDDNQIALIPIIDKITAY